MKIVLLGYGKMGRAIEQIARDRGHEIVARIDVSNRGELHEMTKESADVAIEFSTPEAALDNILLCFEKGWPVVSGTTGWLSERDRVEAVCKEQRGGFFYASNYSIGVNLFFRLATQLARLMKGQPYEVSMTEVHHIHKRDAPSGTAITLAEAVGKGDSNWQGWILSPEHKPRLVPITSERTGEVPGTHSLRYSSGIDTIEITHTAHNRQGFALGAVVAAEWLQGKQGVFGMDDLLADPASDAGNA